MSWRESAAESDFHACWITDESHIHGSMLRGTQDYPASRSNDGQVASTCAAQCMACSYHHQIHNSSGGKPYRKNCQLGTGKQFKVARGHMKRVLIPVLAMSMLSEAKPNKTSVSH